MTETNSPQDLLQNKSYVPMSSYTTDLISVVNTIALHSIWVVLWEDFLLGLTPGFLLAVLMGPYGLQGKSNLGWPHVG